MFTKLGQLFFAPLDAYEPAGMFTMPHFIALGICFVILCLAFFMSRRLTWDQVQRMTRCFAITITVLELIKIGYNFIMVIAGLMRGFLYRFVPYSSMPPGLVATEKG